MTSRRSQLPQPDFPEIRESAFADHPRLAKVQRFVLDNLSEDLNLDRVSEVARLERCYFSTYFREKVGITYRDWRTILRVAKAIEIIRETNTPLSTIAQEVGFGDLRTFERNFKKWMGMTPRDFKRSVRLLPRRSS